jgi:hypothetical protein
LICKNHRGRSRAVPNGNTTHSQETSSSDSSNVHL